MTRRSILNIFGIVGAYFSALMIIRLLLGSGLVWDENWYQNIVVQGYDFSVGSQSAVAFFPLYPLLVKILSFNGAINPIVVATCINYLATVGICIGALNVAVKLHKKISSAHKLLIVLGILAFPTAFFFTSFYVDALLVFLILTSIYFALEHKFVAAFIVAGLASGTKFTGIVAVLVSLAVYFGFVKVSKQNIAKGFGFGVIGISGLLLYMLFLQAKFGDAFAFFTAQNAWGRNDGIFIFELIRQAAQTFTDMFSATVSKSFVIARLLGIIVALVGGVAFAWFLKKKQWWLAMLLAASLGLPLLSGSFDSIARYALVPLPILLAYFVPKITLGNTQKVKMVILIIASAVLQLALYMYFIKGQVFIA